MEAKFLFLFPIWIPVFAKNNYAVKALFDFISRKVHLPIAQYNQR